MAPALYNAFMCEIIENTKRLKVLRNTYANDKHEDEELAGPVGFVGRLSP
jgi:hypothetical protein